MKKRYFSISIAIIMFVAGILIITMPRYSDAIVLAAVVSLLIAVVIFRKQTTRIQWDWIVISIFVLVVLAGIFQMLSLVFKSKDPALSRTFESIFHVAYRLGMIGSIVVAWIYYKRQKKQKQEAENRKDPV